MGGFNQERAAVMRAIIDMKRTTPVMCACEYRNQFINYREMVINEDAEWMNDEQVQLLIEKYWIPLGHRIEHFFSMFGVCPYYIEKIRIGENNDVAHVPRLYEDEGFTIESVKDEKTGKKYFIYRERETDEEIKHVLKSMYHTGPSHNSPYFDSECGAVLAEYLQFLKIRELGLTIIEKEANPPLYIRRELPATNQPTDIAEQTFLEALQVFNRKVDQYGYANKDEKNPRNLRLEQGDGFLALPSQYNTVANVPRPHMLIDESFHWGRLVQLVTSTFKIPQVALELKRDGAMFGATRTSVASDEDRALANNTCMKIVEDIIQAFREVWELIRDEPDIPIYIPIRPHLDMEKVIGLVEFGAISHEHGIEIVLRTHGLVPPKGREGKRRRLVPPKKKLRVDDKATER